MRARAEKNDLIYWFNHVEAQHKSNFSPSHYCKNENLNYQKFLMMKNRFHHKKYTDPATYAKIYAIVKPLYDANEMITPAIARKAGIVQHKLSNALTHLRYLGYLEEEKARSPEIKLDDRTSTEATSMMQFHEVKATNNTPMTVPESFFQSAQQAEVIEPKNELEINIAKGVRVMLSPNIEASTILKIIDLLRDL